MDPLKKAVLSYINMMQGCKATELAVAVAQVKRSGEYLQTIEELVAEGEIVEIEYTVPNIPYRIKSFYLPKGSEILSVPKSESTGEKQGSLVDAGFEVEEREGWNKLDRQER